uniref:Uncharacterized protein n=1 Tax=Leersia perrieri TaxID=77586 RepID=A0A0D9XUR5_9ORYZ
MASSSSLPGLWRLPELLRRRGGSPTRLFLAARMVAQRLRSPVPRGGVGGSTSSPVAHLGDFSGEMRHYLNCAGVNHQESGELPQ